jgi:D-beta-D-heptose 7-phosphate kinase/D-beta-D-heptose 1-phosphate adenosyltransferase
MAVGEIAMISRIPGAKVLVIGDLMLDEYIIGEVTRISPEAPVPIVQVRGKKYSPGGAANVAANLKAMSADCRLAGFLGQDHAGSHLRELLASYQIPTTPLVTTVGKPTTVKSRVTAHGQQLIRVDSEDTSPVSASDEDLLIRGLDEAVVWCEAVLIADYCKGSITDAIAKHLIEKCGSLRPKPLVIVDSKRSDISVFAGADYLTPNRKELETIAGRGLKFEEDIVSEARRLVTEYDLEGLLVTRSEEGCTLVTAGGEVIHSPAVAREVADVTGAGDTVVAALALSIVAGLALSSALKVANVAAGIVVTKRGTATCTLDEIRTVLTYLGGDKR